MLAKSIVSRLRSAGYKITNARRQVIDVLCETDDHLTSTDILERVKSRDPSIGRASVFRVLDLLTELAFIRPTYLISRTPSYVVIPIDGHHAHIICPLCQTVIELNTCELDDLIDRIGQSFGRRISGHLLELYGQCNDCTP